MSNANKYQLIIILDTTNSFDDMQYNTQYNDIIMYCLLSDVGRCFHFLGNQENRIINLPHKASTRRPATDC